ncbi:transposase [Larkinella arboricola]|uniref:Transposase n=1 Tax=Larkinella arboricola TaxID=643671 RepID=A0A327WLF4_LARAB|nr:transposase [Larkinella arboricola]
MCIHPYARWMEACQMKLLQIAMITGGQVGSRVCKLFGLKVSGSTLLRRLLSAPLPAQQTPKVLGVDDWAFKKGDRYGTILVDLEKQKVVDLLPDRETQTLKQWLLDHPGVEIICRDRASTYALVATEGAPQAVQIADRWHLLKNLGDAIERFVEGQQILLRQTAQELSLQGQEAIEDQPVQKPSAPVSNRQIRFEQVKTLQQAGHSGRSIARQLGISRTTVRKYLQWTQYTARKHTPVRTSGVSAYETYIRQRWQEGEQRIAILHAEIQQRGFRGGASSLFRMIRSYPRNPKVLLPLSPQITYYSVRQVSQWLMRPLNSIQDEAARDFIQRVYLNCPLAQTAHKLALQFRNLMKDQDDNGLDHWLSVAKQSEINALRHFSRSLESDYAAVRQAFQSTWSSGQVEGQVNRLKTVKRAMYGRASFELLRRRMIMPSA